MSSCILCPRDFLAPIVVVFFDHNVFALVVDT